jgi:hypothetical protein
MNTYIHDPSTDLESNIIQPSDRVDYPDSEPSPQLQVPLLNCFLLTLPSLNHSHKPPLPTFGTILIIQSSSIP